MALVSAILLAVLWLVGPKSGTVAFEAAKGWIAILTVALAGFVVSRAATMLQVTREAHDRWNEGRRERWRRETEERRDERQRKDALLRSVLEDALENYNDVKRARRQLRARIWARDRGDRIDPTVYDEYLAAINDAQLNFETLRRTAG